jgi:glycogen debranching enzyme
METRNSQLREKEGDHQKRKNPSLRRLPIKVIQNNLDKLTLTNVLQLIAAGEFPFSGGLIQKAIMNHLRTLALLLAMTHMTFAGEVLLRTYPLPSDQPAGRGYILSADGRSFFFGTTAALRDNPFMGLTVAGEKLFDDFRLWQGDRLFDRAAAKTDFWAQGASFATDSVTLILDMAAQDFLRVIALSESPQDFSLELIFAPNSLDERRVRHYSDAMTIAPAENGNYFLAVAWPSPDVLQNRASEIAKLLPDSRFSFGSFYGKLRDHTIAPNWVIAYGSAEDEALKAARELVKDRGASSLMRRNLMSAALAHSSFHTTDSAVADALQWAKKSLLDLQAAGGTELWAGFPWFAEAWGRDTFISLPGAFLVTGNYDAARQILLQFAKWQDKDSTSSTFGRIPNRARPDEIVFNTADGTPWWIREIYEYGLYSGDWELWEQLVAAEPSQQSEQVDGAVRFALRGAIARMDSLGFVRHGDAETWMDAVGPEGAWTPRGDRAVEVQALWHAAFDAALRMAATCTTKIPDAEFKAWFDAREHLAKNFSRYFVRPDGLGLYDHLNSDDSPDRQVRPNQIFALTVPLTPLLSEEVAQTVLRTVIEKCTYPYGVASLAQDDENFHPFHVYPNYPKDAAYHNGTVWLWLSGPVKSILVSSGHGDLAWQIAQVEMNEILKGQTVGTLPELYDAVPQKGESVPRPSGCVSQAWSLAEFCRVFYQDFLGIRPIQLRGEKQTLWRIFPRVPPEWGHTETQVHFGETPVRIALDSSPDSVHIVLQALQTPPKPIPLELFAYPNGVRGMLQGSVPLELEWRKEKSAIEINGYPTTPALLEGWPYTPVTEELHFLKPAIRPGLAALQEPKHERFSGEEITRRNPDAKLIVSLDDPEGDDVGDGDFTYPTESHFEPGILDLTKFELRADKESLYFTLRFRNLVQPGWHPEYGFQLTFAAIAIRSGDCSQKNPCASAVGANAGVTLPEGYEADRFVYVGGGLRVIDGQSKILAEYIPTDPHYPTGDVTQKEVRFALPRRLFRGEPSQWKISILVGAQDDHGGAGLGEFRAVEREAALWVGGGGDGTNRVYDRAFWPPN